jgi:Major Facilitator Superfamily
MQDRSRWIALVVLCTGMLMIVLDMTIVNVALPSIQADLGFSQSSLAWVVNAYLIAFAGLLLLAGRLGDLAGRRNVFLAGLGVFTVASLLCGLAANREMLVAARFLQGIGGALTSAARPRPGGRRRVPEPHLPGRAAGRRRCGPGLTSPRHVRARCPRPERALPVPAATLGLCLRIRPQSWTGSCCARRSAGSSLRWFLWASASRSI